MPLYEFHCKKCDATFEAFQSMSEHGTRLPMCPRCGSSAQVETRLSSFYAVTSRKS